MYLEDFIMQCLCRSFIWKRSLCSVESCQWNNGQGELLVMDQEIRRCDGCKAVWYHIGINDSLYRWLMFRLDRKKWTFDETQCLTFHYLQDKCANVHMKFSQNCRKLWKIKEWNLILEELEKLWYFQIFWKMFYKNTKKLEKFGINSEKFGKDL